MSDFTMPHSWYEPPLEPDACPVCLGDGEVEALPSWTRDPQEARLEACPECHGSGVEERGWPVEETTT